MHYLFLNKCDSRNASIQKIYKSRIKMEIQEVAIKILPDGEVKIMVEGVKGTKCLQLTEDIETLLGNEIILREKTYEYYQDSSLTTSEEIKVSQP